MSVAETSTLGQPIRVSHLVSRISTPLGKCETSDSDCRSRVLSVIAVTPARGFPIYEMAQIRRLEVEDDQASAGDES